MVLDAARGIGYALTAGTLRSFDLDRGDEAWPALALEASDGARCTVLADGRVLVLDPAVPRLTCVRDSQTVWIELPSPPRPEAFFEADGCAFWFATQDGWIWRLRDETLERVHQIPGVIGLTAGGGVWLAQTSDRLIAHH